MRLTIVEGIVLFTCDGVLVEDPSDSEILEALEWYLQPHGVLEVMAERIDKIYGLSKLASARC